MYIPKPYRQLLQLAMFIGIAFLISLIAERLDGFWKILLLAITVPLAYLLAFILSLFVDGFDFWLRRKTRDPVWLMTSEGQKWLETREGKDWQTKHCHKV